MPVPVPVPVSVPVLVPPGAEHPLAVLAQLRCPDWPEAQMGEQGGRLVAQKPQRPFPEPTDVQERTAIAWAAVHSDTDAARGGTGGLGPWTGMQTRAGGGRAGPSPAGAVYKYLVPVRARVLATTDQRR